MTEGKETASRYIKRYMKILYSRIKIFLGLVQYLYLLIAER